ncbi:hypothetical protein AAFF_G00419840 [Aldrovandia affinis]|uniref:Integrase catalytic domain-containing protein n=1 Tax=Aldrovandia affinis TaxID=143900 RepID=A0AAD7WJ33_9TELE|nr:hypothetical protein AAFF_G00419840 [Aldrovandia affinis]
MQAMLQAQGLTDEQRVDFVLGAPERVSRQEVWLVPEAQQRTLEGLLAHPVPLSEVTVGAAGGELPQTCGELGWGDDRPREDCSSSGLSSAIDGAYGWAVPVKDQMAQTTVQAIWKTVVHQCGCPDRFFSGRGPAFESSLVAAFCKLYGTKVRTTPYHPEGNGACERFSHTLLPLLGSLGEEEQSRWPEKLLLLTQGTQKRC